MIMCRATGFKIRIGFSAAAGSLVSWSDRRNQFHFLLRDNRGVVPTSDDRRARHGRVFCSRPSSQFSVIVRYFEHSIITVRFRYLPHTYHHFSWVFTINGNARPRRKHYGWTGCRNRSDHRFRISADAKLTHHRRRSPGNSFCATACIRPTDTRHCDRLRLYVEPTI